MADRAAGVQAAQRHKGAPQDGRDRCSPRQRCRRAGRIAPRAERALSCCRCHSMANAADGAQAKCAAAARKRQERAPSRHVERQEKVMPQVNATPAPHALHVQLCAQAQNRGMRLRERVLGHMASKEEPRLGRL